MSWLLMIRTCHPLLVYINLNTLFAVISQIP